MWYDRESPQVLPYSYVDIEMDIEESCARVFLVTLVRRVCKLQRFIRVALPPLVVKGQDMTLSRPSLGKAVPLVMRANDCVRVTFPVASPFAT